MHYQELSLSTQASLADAFSEQLEALGALSVSLQDATDMPIYEPAPHTHPLWDEIIITALFPEDTDLSVIKKAMQANHQGIIPMHEAQLADQNWVAKNLSDFKPIELTPRLWICPSWHQLDVDATVVRLNPGLAFGTGEHPTTQMILRYLAIHPPLHNTVVDYGCGSGILAITASLLGAAHVYAVDIDEQALVATHNNAELNHLDDKKITICLPDALQQHQVDQLLANIFLTPLLKLRKNFTNVLKPQGQILLSGVLQSQLEQIITAYQEDFSLTVVNGQDGWLLLHGIHKKN